jgi:hypothetical protein
MEADVDEILADHEKRMRDLERRAVMTDKYEALEVRVRALEATGAKGTAIVGVVTLFAAAFGSVVAALVLRALGS